jgi:hypothetical protein
MKKILSFLSMLVISGCAHNIKISPEQTPASTQPKSKTVVAYYVSAADKSLKSTTPGGGGDKVSYQLAKDMEYGFFNVLNGAYETVKVLEASHDVEKMKTDGIALTFEPKFTSTSSGSSMMIWPADKFSITVQCKAYNNVGTVILDKAFTGQGTATSKELMGNFALAANKAAADVLDQIKKEISSNAVLK